jgi:hypothetical protein
MRPAEVTRWVGRNGLLIELIHATHTTGNRDGWRLICRHPRSRVVISEIPLGAEMTPDIERWLAIALADIDAIPVIGRKGRR